MLLIHGPNHIDWNAYKTVVQKTEGWERHLEVTTALLSLLGQRGLRQRFLERNMQGSESWERALFHGWSHRVVDWKWGYMEGAFKKLDAAIEVFFDRFDLQQFQTSGGIVPAGDTSEPSIDPKAGRTLAEAKKDRWVIAATMSAHAAFAEAVGRHSRWFTACDCHDYIWTMPNTSEKEKQRRRYSRSYVSLT